MKLDMAMMKICFLRKGTCRIRTNDSAMGPFDDSTFWYKICILCGPGCLPGGCNLEVRRVGPGH